MKAQLSLVSIIVPCYNYGHLLPEALESVAAQTYQNWECIIVDDGSTDNTRIVSEKYSKADPRFIYVYQKNKGLSGARNTGLRIAKGSYIQLLDSDDILPNTKIQNHVSVLDLHNDVDLVYGTVFIFDKHLTAVASAKPFILQKPLSGTRDQVLTSLIEDNMFLVHCTLFRRSVLHDVGFFREEMITCEDWNFWFRCALVGKKFLFLDNYESRVYVRNHGINMSTNRKNMWIGRISFRKEADVLLSTEKGQSFDRIKQRNLQLLRVMDTRLNLAYGNILLGIGGTAKIIYHHGGFLRTTYDSLYWIKERLLKRV